MTYNKKQMQPLIDKYQINPETNKLFISVVEMFDGQTNYQNWAVKMIFSQVLTFDELKEIHDWIAENQSQISKLEKKNIVAYSNKGNITQLKKEIKGLEMINFIKMMISHFNTEQKKMLTKCLVPDDLTPIGAYSNRTVNEWYKIFNAFNKKPMARKNKFYSTCSAIKSIDVLLNSIKGCLAEEYTWDKEDMLSFLEANASDCEIVHNEGPIVIVRVPSYSSSHKLCGSGRTQWCITRESHFFTDYVTRYDGKRNQYFLFDFSRKETDCFAHIGFTVENGNGIIIAQTCDNKDMMYSFTQGNENFNIHSLLAKIGVKESKFIRLPRNIGYKWDINTVVKMAETSPQDFSIAYMNGNKLVLKVKSNISRLISHTFIKPEKYDSNSFCSVYLFMDFDLLYNEEKSIIAMLYNKDIYGTQSCARSTETYGHEVPSSYLTSLGITEDKYINFEHVDPSIILHKWINTKNEEEAIKLIEEDNGQIDVNFELNGKIPVFSAINEKMSKLFKAIINHPSFDVKTESGFGDTLLETLLYLYGTSEINILDGDKEMISDMINAIITSSNKFDFNELDLNGDTAINIACQFPSELQVVENLASRKSTNVNIVNGFGYDCIKHCISNNNLRALEIIGKRPDLVVTKEHKKFASEHNVNLDDFIKPSEDIFKNEEVYADESLVEELSVAASA